jgi:hypothetical protein
MLKRKLMLGACLVLALGLAQAQPKVDADAEARRVQNEEMLKRALAEEEKNREVEEKRAAALAAREQADLQREKQLARDKQERAAIREQELRLAECHFKGVMSDADIARCRAAYSR